MAINLAILGSKQHINWVAHMRALFLFKHENIQCCSVATVTTTSSFQLRTIHPTHPTHAAKKRMQQLWYDKASPKSEQRSPGSSSCRWWEWAGLIRYWWDNRYKWAWLQFAHRSILDLAGWICWNWTTPPLDCVSFELRKVERAWSTKKSQKWPCLTLNLARNLHEFAFKSWSRLFVVALNLLGLNHPMSRLCVLHANNTQPAPHLQQNQHHHLYIIIITGLVVTLHISSPAGISTDAVKTCHNYGLRYAQSLMCWAIISLPTWQIHGDFHSVRGRVKIPSSNRKVKLGKGAKKKIEKKTNKC